MYEWPLYEWLVALWHGFVFLHSPHTGAKCTRLLGIFEKSSFNVVMLEYGKFGYGTAQGNIDVYISISCRALSYVGPSAVYLFMTSFFAIEKNYARIDNNHCDDRRYTQMDLLNGTDLTVKMHRTMSLLPKTR